MKPLADYLAEQDVPCPVCGYNLRGCQGTSCPECGQGLAIQITTNQEARPRRALRYLFLGLIIWNGAGTLPVAIVEMLRFWQVASGTGSGGGFVWYVAGEIVHAVVILWLAILGLRSCRGPAGCSVSTSRYAFTILLMQILVTIYHIVIVIFI